MYNRVKIDYIPYTTKEEGAIPWNPAGRWPCNWISGAAFQQAPAVTAYRLRFYMKEADIVRVHVSADERYELYIDGIMSGRGSERGDINN